MNFTTDTLYSEIERRLAAGEPFTSARAAWGGYEYVGQVNGWIVGLDLNSNKVLALSATNRRQAAQLPKLPIATRPNASEWSSLLDRAAFDRWAAQLATEEKPRTIWEIFSDLVERQDITVLPGKEQLLWESGSKKVVIFREKQRDVLRLVARNGKTTMSQPLSRWGRNHASRNGDCGGCWKLVLDAQGHYTAWIQEAQ